MSHSSKTLIVTDSLESDWYSQLADSQDYVLLTFSISAEAVIAHHRDSLSGLSLEVLQTRDLSSQAEEEIREFAPRLIETVGAKFKKELTWRSRDLWRYLIVSEKSIWRGKLVHYLYALSRLDRALAETGAKTVVLALADGLLSTVVIEKLARTGVTVSRISEPPPGIVHRFWRSYARQAVTTAASTFIKKVWLAFAYVKPRDLQFGQDPKLTALFTIYPFYWTDPYSSTQIKERFFQDMPRWMDEAKHPYVFLAWLTQVSQLAKRRNEALTIFEQRKIIPLETFTSMVSILRLLSPFIAWKVKRFLSQLSRPRTLTFRDYDISSIVQEDASWSATHAEFFRCLILEDSLARALNRIRPSSLIYRFEFQPYESALVRACRGRTRAVGFQHAALSRNFLNYVYPTGTLSTPTSPAPDFILTTGHTGPKILSKSGFPEKNMSIVGPIRYQPMLDYLSRRPSRDALRLKYDIPSSTRVIFVAAAQIYQETLSMLSSLLEAIRGQEKEYFVVLKPHPEVPKGDRYQALLEQYLDPKGFRIMHGMTPFYDFLSLSDALLLTGSTVGAEALALGVVPIVYECPSQFINNPLVEIPKSALFVDSAEALKKALAQLFSSSASKTDFLERSKQDLTEVFFDLHSSPQKRTIEVLTNL